MYKELRYVETLAQHGSYRKAAQMLHISQSQLSRVIQAFERDIGVVLFERGPNGAEPTANGRSVLVEISSLLSAEQAFNAKISQIKRQTGQGIRLGLGPVVHHTWGPAAVSSLTRSHPAVALSVREVEWWKLPDAALSDEFDLVIGECSEAESHPDIIVERLPIRPAGLFVRAGHPLDGSRDLKLSDLAEFPLAAPRLPGRIGKFIGVESNLGRMSKDSDHFLPMIETASPRSIIDVVLASNAVGLSMRPLCSEALEARSVVELPIRAPWLCVRQGIMHARGRTLSPAMRALRTAAKIAERRYFPE